MMNRDEHVAWCKRRALEYVAAGLLDQAVASMASDMSQHPETIMPPELAYLGVLDAQAGDADAVNRWINGFR